MELPLKNDDFVLKSGHLFCTWRYDKDGDGTMYYTHTPHPPDARDPEVRNMH